MMLVGSFAANKFGGDLLLMLNRGLLHLRASEQCLKLCWAAAAAEWNRQYAECLHWARRHQ
jgi:hypothetical protein